MMWEQPRAQSGGLGLDDLKQGGPISSVVVLPAEQNQIHKTPVLLFSRQLPNSLALLLG